MAQEGVTWKISDFGISEIKYVKRDSPEPQHAYSLLRIFGRRKLGEDPSSGVKNTRYGGMYAAPEAKEESGQVTRAADVWSLGCIFALVLNFVDGGKQGIESFSKTRGDEQRNATFFQGRDAGTILHPSVPAWLRYLTKRAWEKSKG